jgi:hypothetical protein
MKKYLLLICGLILVCSNGLAQGTCASPDGAMISITNPPTDYDELETGGYCMNGTGSTGWHTMCFTFEPTVGDVAINMGYNSSCVNTSFSTMTLYDNTCTEIGNGLTFTNLTPGETYTWCILMRAWGGPTCNGFERVCPYWMDNSPLPIELEGTIDCEDNIITWTTATEINNDYFIIEKTNTGNYWEYTATVYGEGTSYTSTDYVYQDLNCKGETLYKLKQVDFDGKEMDLPMVICECDGTSVQNIKIIGAFNQLGQEIDPYNPGFKVLKIKDGNRVVYEKTITIRQ